MGNFFVQQPFGKLWPFVRWFDGDSTALACDNVLETYYEGVMLSWEDVEVCMITLSVACRETVKQDFLLFQAN